VAIKNKHILYMLRYECCYPNKMRGQHRKRAQEKITNDSALATEPKRPAKVSEAVEIIKHLAPCAAPWHASIPASGIHRSGSPPNLWSQSRTGTFINFHIFEEVRNPDRQGVVLY